MNSIIFSLEQNENLNDNSKNIMATIINEYNNMLSLVNCLVNEDNLNLILSEISFIEKNVDDISYDAKRNKIIIPDTKEYDYTANGDKLNDMMIKTLLSVISTIHNEDGTITTGVLFKKGNKMYGKVLNEVIINKINELTFGNADYIVDGRTKAFDFKDGLFRNFEEIIGSEKLLKYFLNGQGEELFLEITQMFGSSESALEFFEIMEEANSIEPNEIEKAHKLVELEYNIEKNVEFLKSASKNNKISKVA